VPAASPDDAAGGGASAGGGAEDGAAALGPRLTALIARATAPNPLNRPADADEFLAELQESADDRYGAGWEEEGRSDLARAAAALLALAAGITAGAMAGAGSPAPAAAQSPTASAATTLAKTARRARRAGRLGAGHGPAIAIAAGVIVVAAAGTAVAVVIATHHHHHRGPAQAGPSAAASPGPSLGFTPSGSPSASATPSPSTLAVNPSDPCTWLTPADFAKAGITTGPLHHGSFPGGWRACRNGGTYVGTRSAFLSACPPTLGLFTCTSVSVPGASSAQYLVIPHPSEIEIHAERGGVQYSIGVPGGTGGAQGALIQLMALVLARTAAAS